MDNRLKVCLVTISLDAGGAEKSTAELSKILTNLGHDVHIVTLTNRIVYSYSGVLFNVAKMKQSNESIFSRLSRFITLRNYLKTNKFDFIIDNRSHQLAFRELFYLLYIYRSIKLIYVIRSSKLDMYFPKNKWVVNLMMKKAVKFIAVSKGIELSLKKAYNNVKITTIYNSVELKKNLLVSKKNESYILFFGRLEDDVKNISLLIKAFKESQLQDFVCLRIFGDGKDKAMLEKKVNNLGLSESVIIHPFMKNIEQQIINSKFVVLSSHFEGFPRALIESLSLGIPVVSVDCPTGPNEIIINEENGLLVENYNTPALSKAMQRMIYDVNLYKRCKLNAKKSVQKLDKRRIAEEWSVLLNSLA